ncbi:hypothetical protein BVH03_17770 [Pseudomonas sp. PA15(2017)]|uniref:integrating conjugative element protein n=1 Tax=Pseudomonas sp. PA15(2017) TaxID=1932111 RepID=UPI0009679A2E|nr:integrating conjugative element protein [Pseudomonas sp. PA15(2017)]OLU25501.1 hypothetical protein BVH03_17770 [Pseudomonas sp. PA15(2017)]
MKAIQYLIACTVLLAPSLSSAMTVVADHGGIPAAPFYDSLNLETKALQTPAPMLSHPVSTEQMLPVLSQLTPGKVDAKPVTLATLPAPLFVVGDDSMSLSWLQQHQDTLRRLQAIGWAVNVRDQASLDRIRQAVPGLAVKPMHVDDFAQRIGLRHYPALITRSSVEQ